MATKSIHAQTSSLYELPVIDWGKIGAEAPEVIPFEKEGAYTELPKADYVVMTWTDAEWSALDHVFVHSYYKRTPTDTEFRYDWREFKDASSGTRWGYFAMLKIKNQAGKELVVMAFKAECHLSHQYVSGVVGMVQALIQSAKPEKLFSIGTSGGATLNEALGDVAVTNAGHVKLEKPQNDNVPYNNTTVESDWFPSFYKLNEIEEQLFIPLSEVLTPNEWNSLLDEFHKSTKGSESYTLADMINAPLENKNIDSPRALLTPGKPLLTTDYYFIASPEGMPEYCALEMDDAVVGHEAGKLGVDYVFVRNMSDTIVAGKTTSGETIPNPVRNGWSSTIYNKCGFYTSFNGALTAWSAVVGS